MANNRLKLTSENAGALCHVPYPKLYEPDNPAVEEGCVAKAKLTGKQRRLVGELRQLLSTLMLDPDAIIADEDVEGHTPRLELAKDQLIRSAVI